MAINQFQFSLWSEIQKDISVIVTLMENWEAFAIIMKLACS